MRRFVVLAVLLCCSCSERLATVEETVDVCFSTGMTKASDGISSLEVYAFKDGKLYSFCRANGPQLTLSVPKNARISYCAAANTSLGYLPLFEREEDFYSCNVSLGQNADRLIMSGYGSSSFDRSSTCVIHLSRILSRVVVESLALDFEYEGDAVCDMVWLLSMTGTVRLDGGALYERWYNMWENSTLQSNFSRMYCSEANFPVELLCCPNQTPEVRYDDDWTPRRTKLVIEMTVAGEKCYYPIPLPLLYANESYVIHQVRLLGPGAPSPNDPIDRKSVEISASFVPWTNLPGKTIVIE